MKSNEKFLKLLNEIDDKYLEEAEEYTNNHVINFEEKKNEKEKKSNIFNIKYLSLAASMFLIPVLIFSLINRDNKGNDIYGQEEISMYNETDDSYTYKTIEDIKVRSKDKNKLDIKYINELKKEKEFYLKLNSLENSDPDKLKDINDYYIDLDEKKLVILTLTNNDKFIDDINKLNSNQANISILEIKE